MYIQAIERPENCAEADETKFHSVWHGDVMSGHTNRSDTIDQDQATSSCQSGVSAQ